jgi:ABC-2 type transport system permease protein
MLAVLYRVVLRNISTRGRVLGLLALGITGVVVGIGIGLADDVDRLEAGTGLANTFGMSLFVPVVTLVFASAALGDLAEDGTLVYLWARPVARWKIAVAAFAASVSVALPLVLGSLGVATLATGAGSELVVGTLSGAAVAVVAYAGIFSLVGLRVRRALVWGLAYVLLWEGFVASAGDNAARLAIRSYSRSLLSHATGEDLRLADRSVAACLIVPTGVAAVAVLLTSRHLRRTDVA